MTTVAEAKVASPRRRRPPATWRVPLVLIGFSLVAVLASTARLVQLLGGPEAIPADDRFESMPAPVIVHAIASIFYATVGAFQFSVGVRRRWLRWHRTMGRVLVGVGLIVGVTALVMTLVYPFKAGTGPLLFVTRLIVGTAMTASVALGFFAARQRRLRDHRAWMIRAYALGLGAATQTVTLGFGEPVFGTGPIAHDLLMAAGWAINAAVAEILIRRPKRSPAAAVAV